MTIVIIFLCIIFGIFVNYLPFLFRIVQNSKLKKYCKTNGILVLTYDDGPGQKLTEEVKEILDRYNVKATFFCLGFRASISQKVIQSLIEQGHEVASHGQNHFNYLYSFPYKVVKDIKKGFKSIYGTLKPNSLFRPPWGKITLIPWLYLLLHSIKVCWWTYATGDTYKSLKPFELVANDIKNMNGGIILMHDFDRQRPFVQNEQYVLDITEMLIEMSINNKWKIMTFSQLINASIKNLK